MPVCLSVCLSQITNIYPSILSDPLVWQRYHNKAQDKRAYDGTACPYKENRNSMLDDHNFWDSPSKSGNLDFQRPGQEMKILQLSFNCKLTILGQPFQIWKSGLSGTRPGNYSSSIEL
jgi:hypothetical protein